LQLADAAIKHKPYEYRSVSLIYVAQRASSLRLSSCSLYVRHDSILCVLLHRHASRIPSGGYMMPADILNAALRSHANQQQCDAPKERNSNNSKQQVLNPARSWLL
jgi:hypothetical protein